MATAASIAPRTPFHLSDEQIARFDADGFLVLRRWVTGPLLARLQAAGDAWIADGARVRPEEAGDDYNFAARADGPALFRINYVHHKGQPASLELLGSPQVLAVAESLCGSSCVPTYESMVFKQAGDGERIPWHQDAVQPSDRFRIFNFDLYLDASRAGAGALRVIPGSHRARQDVCAIAERYGWEHPDAVETELEPGDVLLHHVMVVHGSPPTVGKALRRTIYYEFRPAEEILEDGPWDQEWIERRMRLIPLGLRRYRERFPEAPQFAWNVAPAFRPRVGTSEAAELKVAHVVHMGGSWCSAGDAVRAE
jgi:ectoine hydroxylase-related dioxygenase (phytanoyl-CoA dioxygenase family)